MNNISDIARLVNNMNKYEPPKPKLYRLNIKLSQKEKELLGDDIKVFSDILKED